MLRYKTKTRPGLVALYDIRPGNGAGPFLQPRSPHGASSLNAPTIGVGALKTDIRYHQRMRWDGNAGIPISKLHLTNYANYLSNCKRNVCLYGMRLQHLVTFYFEAAITNILTYNPLMVITVHLCICLLTSICCRSSSHGLWAKILFTSYRFASFFGVYWMPRSHWESPPTRRNSVTCERTR